METRKRILDTASQADIAGDVADLLKAGGICIIPTDTIYGIVALDRFSVSVRRIFDIKKRPSSKPFIKLIGSLDSLTQYTDQVLPSSLHPYWPGPLTLILRGRSVKTVAVRFPDAPFLKDVFSHLGGEALVAPSANISGDSNIFNCEQLVDVFQGLVDLIVCLKGGLRESEASTILDITQEPWKVLRQGSLVVETPDHSAGKSRGEM
jgi:L-threonylcarbamoyladenylate synthase